MVCLFVLQQCSKPTGGPTTPTPPTSPTPAPPALPTPAPPVPGPQTFVGAGDIAMCNELSRAEATAKLLDTIGGTVFTLGDNAYPSGSAENFRDCYNPTWGRHRDRTRPAPGNHDYETPNAAGYYQYFGANAGPAGAGFYSYNLGAWHIISLNSDTRMQLAAQTAWLREDLAANSSFKCTLAYWHHPVFSSGLSGNNPHMRETFKILHDNNADVVLSAHDHSYERFAPQDADGRPDPVRGIREFVVGTGGATSYVFMRVSPNSEQQITGPGTNGVLRMTLNAESYGWEFITTGTGIRDNGMSGCH
jgi:hypothetical protein